MESEGEILPEDDSIFMNLSNRDDNISSDALLEDSFSGVASRSPVTSTPADSRKASIRNAQSRSTSSAVEASPARLTRSASRTASPSTRSPIASSSSSTHVLLQNQSNSPSRLTRSATRALGASPLSAGPSSETIATSPSINASPSRVTRSATRASTSATSDAPPRSTRSASQSTSSAASSHSIIGIRPIQAQAVHQKQKESSKLKCPKCPNVLANKKTMDTHLRGHLMQGVTSRAPSREDLGKELPNMIDAVLNELIAEPVIGSLSAMCHDNFVTLCSHFKENATGESSEMCSSLSGHFSDILKGKKALFPSSIRTAMYGGTNKLLSSTEFLLEVRGYFTFFCDADESVINVMVGSFMLSLSQKVLVFVIKTMHGNMDDSETSRRKRSSDDVHNVEFQQLVYHIGGSIINGFMWKGVQYSDSSRTWALFCEVLKEKFLRSKDGLNQCSDVIRAHTEGMDRGGLKHLSDAAYDFFLRTFDLLMSLEGDDGSLPSNVIDQHVLQNDVLLCLWDVLVGEDLGESDSLDLLVQITQSCVKVTLKGIMKRRLNSELKKAYDSVALRARLAK